MPDAIADTTPPDAARSTPRSTPPDAAFGAAQLTEGCRTAELCP